jgi:hypothetical protein
MEPHWSQLGCLLQDIGAHPCLTDPTFPSRAVIERLGDIGRYYNDAVRLAGGVREPDAMQATVCSTWLDFSAAGLALYEAVRDVPKNQTRLISWVDPVSDEPCAPAAPSSDPERTTAPAASVAPDAAASSKEPAKYLMCWREVLAALGLRNTEEARRRVRRMNELRQGPIVMPRRGGQPTVERGKLLAWWNSLEQAFEDSEQRHANQQATTSRQYAHGWDATVVPDLGGSVKRRRRAENC